MYLGVGGGGGGGGGGGQLTLRIDEQRLLPSGGMGSNNWVLRDYGFPADYTTTALGSLGLLYAGVCCFETLEALSKGL
jgi:hypothetical protein